jgi:hypothetical protein
MFAREGITRENVGKESKTGKDALPAAPGPWSRELVKEIAMDIAKETVAHIEFMYPAALLAAPSTFPLSVRNKIFNEIMAAIEVNDAGQIAVRLERRRKLRRKLTADFRKLRQKQSRRGDARTG